jgi:hypothetical protein
VVHGGEYFQEAVIVTEEDQTMKGCVESPKDLREGRK